MSKKLTEADLDEIVARYAQRLPDGTWEGSTALAKAYGVTPGVIQYQLKKRGIAIRSRSESHAGKQCKPVTNLPKGEAPDCACNCGEKAAWSQRKNHWNKYAKGHHPLGYRAGPENPAWNGGKTWQKYPGGWNTIARKIRERDNWVCQDCGGKRPENARQLPVHHIDGDKLNNDPSNLVSLCAWCHRRRHATKS
jgi:hypothetical protein